MVRMILEGGRAVCRDAGIPVAGGHSIDCPEPVYGLAVVGTCKTDEIRRNADARPGDALILTKPLGVGIYSAAIKKAMLSPGGYAEMIATTTLLNRVGVKLAKAKSVHAMTDVTGFGLLGHGLEMARGSHATLVIDLQSLPFLADAESLTQQGCVTGASARNWASYESDVDLPQGLPGWRRDLLTDPQPSGGLLVACDPQQAGAVARTIAEDGYPFARIVGRFETGAPRIRVDG
jgi:selenide,water dikinase